MSGTPSVESGQVSDTNLVAVPIPDPNNVTVVFANFFGGGGSVDNVINFALVVMRFTPRFDGKIENDPVIAARIRLDFSTAFALRNFLDSQIQLLSAPKEKPN